MYLYNVNAKFNEYDVCTNLLLYGSKPFSSILWGSNLFLYVILSCVTILIILYLMEANHILLF